MSGFAYWLITGILTVETNQIKSKAYTTGVEITPWKTSVSDYKILGKKILDCNIIFTASTFEEFLSSWLNILILYSESEISKIKMSNAQYTITGKSPEITMLLMHIHRQMVQMCYIILYTYWPLSKHDNYLDTWYSLHLLCLSFYFYFSHTCSNTCGS